MVDYSNFDQKFENIFVKILILKNFTSPILKQKIHRNLNEHLNGTYKLTNHARRFTRQYKANYKKETGVYIIPYF